MVGMVTEALRQIKAELAALLVPSQQSLHLAPLLAFLEPEGEFDAQRMRYPSVGGAYPPNRKGDREAPWTSPCYKHFPSCAAGTCNGIAHANESCPEVPQTLPQYERGEWRLLTQDGPR
jgi:hypothetical protein